MKLKSFFFPIVLVICISISVGFIWPEITSVKTINAESIVKKENLAAIEAKKSAIEMIGSKLISDGGKENTVKSYLPEIKTEERILSSVNYLAGDANVSLVDISLSEVKVDAAASASVAAPVMPTAPAAGGIQPAAMVNPDGTVVQPVSPASQVRKMSAKITIVGNYEKIRIFLDGISHMPLFNTVKSLEISKQQSSTGVDGQPVDESLLSANVVVEFGYLDVPKINSASASAFKSNLDEEAISVLQKYVSAKSQQPMNVTDAKGKINPFMPN